MVIPCGLKYHKLISEPSKDLVKVNEHTKTRQKLSKLSDHKVSVCRMLDSPKWKTWQNFLNLKLNIEI